MFSCGKKVTVIQARLVGESTPFQSECVTSEQVALKIARHYSYALAVLASGDTLASIHQLHEVLMQDSTYWAAYYSLGLIDSPYDEPTCADHYRDALRFAPPEDSVRSMIYIAMGACHEKQTALGYAEQNYRTALQLNPSSEPAREGLERVLALKQDER